MVGVLVSERSVVVILDRSEEHTSELQSHLNLVCRLLLEKKKNITIDYSTTLISYKFSFFFFNDTATTEIYTLSLHDALPICTSPQSASVPGKLLMRSG